MQISCVLTVKPATSRVSIGSPFNGTGHKQKAVFIDFAARGDAMLATYVLRVALCGDRRDWRQEGHEGTQDQHTDAQRNGRVHPTVGHRIWLPRYLHGNAIPRDEVAQADPKEAAQGEDAAVKADTLWSTRV